MTPPDPLQSRIPHDDWSDQDLLTKGEAAERLTAEIAEVTAKLTASNNEDQTLARRLRGLRAAYQHLTGGPLG
ncbi:hypothetical protein [Mycobacterium simiae]|uniref:hypothetical protein n=1 Tax=Mycobacterium simiae TaxID=1784 RepID=UPI0004296CD2|nr:hypothetical protein [Mycobacterium simiae]PLV54856.1 hypothetical protein X011_00565 [Mycobacterium tuberculosis variant microti OV254]BBX41948.1 hypothetical protein MSIM_33990 [Mycobacterium simiae]